MLPIVMMLPVVVRCIVGIIPHTMKKELLRALDAALQVHTKAPRCARYVGLPSIGVGPADATGPVSRSPVIPASAHFFAVAGHLVFAFDCSLYRTLHFDQWLAAGSSFSMVQPRYTGGG
jgi:hypothetical protein